MRLFLLVYILICSTLFFFSNTGSYDPTLCAILLSIDFCLLIYCFIHKYKDLSKQPRPSLIFMLSSFIVSFQFFIDALLEYVPVYVEKPFYNENLISYGVILSSISFAAMVLGYESCNKIKGNGSIHSHLVPHKATIKIVSLSHILSFLLWLSTLSLADLTGASYLGSGDYELAVDSGSYAELLYSIISYVLFTTILLQHNNNVETSVSSFFKILPTTNLIICILYVCVKLLSGDRGGAVTTIVIMTFLYLQLSRKHIKVIWVLGGLFLGSVLISAIGIGRGYGDSLSFDQKLALGLAGEYAYEKDVYPSVLSSTQELASSVFCTQIALDDTINLNKEIHNGTFHMCYILECIPFIGSKIINEVLNIPRNEKSSSAYVTMKYLGNYPTYGLGTNLTADFYLDFGIIGVIICMFFIGGIYKRIDYIFAHQNIRSVFEACLFIVLTASSINLPRGYFMFYVRNVLFVFIIYSTINYLCKQTIKR